MESSEVYQSLVRRMRRSRVIVVLLSNASMGASALAFFIPGGPPWGVAACLACMYFHMCRGRLARRYNSAWIVFEYPQLVYWAHSTSKHQAVSDDPIHDGTLVMLHLQDGTKIQLKLPPDQMRTLIDWLVEKNPSVRLGAYD